jgi:hypothetical protein
LTIFREKIGVFLKKNNVLIKTLHNLALFRVKNANFFAEFFGKNIFKIITSVPGKKCSSVSGMLRQSVESLWSGKVALKDFN